MLEDYQEQQRKRITRMRSTMDFTMGALLLLIGLYFLTYQKLGINIFRKNPSDIDYLIGGLFVLYGIWRIYRGYKKDYFR
jgi:hypothetical protein